MVLLVPADTNGLRFHHSFTSESTSTAQVNLPLLINGKHAEKQKHATFLNSFTVLFLYTKFAIISKTQKMQKNLFAVFAYFSHSVVLKSSTSLFWLTAEHSKKVIIRLVWMNTNSAGLITEQPSCSSLYWAVILFLILLSLSKEVKFKTKLKRQNRNDRTAFFFRTSFLNHK